MSDASAGDPAISKHQLAAMMICKWQGHHGCGRRALLSMAALLCACFKGNSGGIFSTKFILAPKVNLWTAIVSTKPCSIPKENMYANRYACIKLAYTLYMPLQEPQSGGIAVQLIIVSD